MIEQWKIQYLYCTVPCTVSRDDNNKNHVFPLNRCISSEKTCYCYTFYNENHTYVPVHNCNKGMLFVKNILAYCEFSPTSPFFLLLSEHKKHCDNTATNSNSKNARSRMVAILQGSVGTGTKEDESSTGRVWAAGFHHVTARSGFGRFLKLTNRLFLQFSKFFFFGSR